MTKHRRIHGDCLKVIPKLKPTWKLVIADPPYENGPLVRSIIRMCIRHKCPLFIFMYAEDLCSLNYRVPDQVLFWIKAPSTKNTVHRYSRFVEVIAAYNLTYSPFNQNTYWHARSGVFTDTMGAAVTHKHEKPVSLMEKLILVNSNIGDCVLDPFAGSESVRKAAERTGRSSISIEVNP